jgi:hypothetical protein
VKRTTSYPTLLAGIDPGLHSGGMVALSSHPRERVLEAISLVEAKGAIGEAKTLARRQADAFGGWSDLEFLTAVIRCESWMQRFGTALDRLEADYGVIEVFAIESFVDQRSRAREEKQLLLKGRWKTPLLMGMLAIELGRRGATTANGRVVYQNAGVVLSQWSGERARLKARRNKKLDLIVEGDRLVTNDHQRTALAHVLALSLRIHERGALMNTPDPITEEAMLNV